MAMAVNMQMRILVVDDARAMLKIVGDILGQIGFRNIVEAASGEAALEILKNEVIDLIVSDWNMQPIDGLALLKAVRADTNLYHIPFIMVTSESKVDNVLTAKEAGVNNYIVKPFNAETLKKKLVAVLGEF
jgi:two-component system chemotaxis response regulator CheY